MGTVWRKFDITRKNLRYNLMHRFLDWDWEPFLGMQQFPTEYARLDKENEWKF